MKKCEDCPIIPETERAMNVVDWGCLPDKFQALEWYKKTWRLWACHDNPKKPCTGLIRVLKREWIKIDLSKPLITESTTKEELEKSEFEKYYKSDPMKLTTLQLKYVDYIPVEREEGILYLCQEYHVSCHRCPCGCGKDVILDHNRWEYSILSDTITVRPSVWSFNLPCKSHYFITNNQIEWL